MSFRAIRRAILSSVPVAALLAVGSFAATASAEPPAQRRARALFDDGRKLAKDARFAEACPKFVQSFQLDPGPGTEFNLADCLEHIGEFERARTLFIDVTQKSLDAGQKARAQAAHDRAAALAAKPAPLAGENVEAVPVAPAPPEPAKVEVPEVVIKDATPEPAKEAPSPAVAVRVRLQDETLVLAEAAAKLRQLRAAAALLAQLKPEDPRARQLSVRLAALERQLSNAWQAAGRVEALADRSARWEARSAKAVAVRPTKQARSSVLATAALDVPAAPGR